MSLDRKDRFFIHLATLALAGTGALAVFPTHTEIGWALILAAALISFIVELVHRRPRVFEAVSRTAPGLRLPWTKPDPFMSLRDAARELYGANTNEMLGKWVRGQTDGSEDEILNWLTYWIAARFVTVYGKRPASTVLEEIPPVRFTLGGVNGGASRIERDGQDTFVDLAVRRDAFRGMIPALSNTECRGDPHADAQPVLLGRDLRGGFNPLGSVWVHHSRQFVERGAGDLHGVDQRFSGIVELHQIPCCCGTGGSNEQWPGDQVYGGRRHAHRASAQPPTRRCGGEGSACDRTCSR